MLYRSGITKYGKAFGMIRWKIKQSKRVWRFAMQMKPKMAMMIPTSFTLSYFDTPPRNSSAIWRQKITNAAPTAAMAIPPRNHPKSNDHCISTLQHDLKTCVKSQCLLKYREQGIQLSWLERVTDNDEVCGSSPHIPTIHGVWYRLMPSLLHHKRSSERAVFLLLEIV